MSEKVAINYSTLTDNELNKEIAKRLGYTSSKQHLTILNDMYVKDADGDVELFAKAGEYDVWVIVDPDGKPLNPIPNDGNRLYEYDLHTNEDDAWAGEVYKNWVGNIYQALMLIKDDSNYAIHPSVGWEVSYTTYSNDNFDTKAHVIRENFARAICECWLQVQNNPHEQ